MITVKKLPKTFTDLSIKQIQDIKYLFDKYKTCVEGFTNDPEPNNLLRVKKYFHNRPYISTIFAYEYMHTFIKNDDIIELGTVESIRVSTLVDTEEDTDSYQGYISSIYNILLVKIRGNRKAITVPLNWVLEQCEEWSKNEKN